MKESISLGALDVILTTDEQSVTYTFQGAIDENFDYKRIPLVEKQRVFFHLRYVNSFNSCGVREWIYFSRTFAQQMELVVEECSVIMFDQFNVVPQIFQRMHIESFFAPYFCSKCNEEVGCLIRVSEHRNLLNEKIAPSFSHHCGHSLEFDGLEESYFINF